MAEDFAEKKVDGESEEVGSLGDRYLGHSINISEPRFCGLGTVTAALATRFQLGLPSALRQLPVRILLTVRHPVDVVVARLHAKWVRGAPAWPECTLSTIRSCAQQLCGSMEQMLRTLDSRKAEGVGDELLRILRWETFSRRKQRVVADLLSWLGVEVNRTTLAAMMLQVDAEVRAFKALSDKAPISPRSRYMVEQTCANVMERLGYRPSVMVTSSHLSQERGQRYVERRRNGAEATAAPAPRMVLGHTSTPQFYFCPVRLAGAEVIMRFFVRRDNPQATVAPLCFPESVADHCPMRHGPKWHRSRWGAYPFDVFLVQSLPPNATTVAVVRNPWDRLVSAFIRFIAKADKTTAIHRAWIRELYGLDDHETITFSHFVRWVAQQESSVMHRAWQPMTETCRFSADTSIVRLEHLESDFKQIMRSQGLGAADERIFEQVLSKTRPLHPIGGNDRQLRMLHFYLTDDAHDLVDIVRRRYRADIEFFRYSFPENRTLTFGV